MRAFAQDLRYALRQFRKSRSSALMAIITLSLGIGANTAIFLLTYSILLKSLPVPAPGQLICFSLSTNDAAEIPITYSLYKAMREHQVATSSLFAAWSDQNVPFREGSIVSQIPVAMVTGSMFPVLEIHPYIGRAFDENAGERDQPFVPEVLLGYDFWRTHFKADPAVLGRGMNLGGTDLAIVGVLPPGFEGINPGVQFDAYVPLSFERIFQPKFALIDHPGAFWLTVIGRLRTGLTQTAAEAAVAGSQALLFNEAEFRDYAFSPDQSTGGFRIVASSARTGVSGLHREYQKPLWALECLCALMMLLCAANTGLLILSRVSNRFHEFAVRIALGAPPSRLVRDVLIETTILAAIGLSAGVLLGWQVAHTLLAMIITIDTPMTFDLSIGAAVILFAIFITAGCALLAGLWPAWLASRTAPAIDLRQIHGNRKAARLGRWIIPSQVMLGLVLIYAALLLSDTLRAYLHQRSGFVTDGITLAEFNYQNKDISDPLQIRRGFQLAHRLENTPGIQSATILSSPPLRGWNDVADYFTRDAIGFVHHSSAVWEEDVSPGYFDVMGTAILEGRSFIAADVSGDKVCVISRSTANFFFKRQNPLGSFITAGDGLPPKQSSGDKSSYAPDSYRIIGVADDAHMQSLLSPPPMVVYRLAEQQKNSLVLPAIAIRSGNTELAAEAIRRTTAEIMPGLPFPKIYTLERAVTDDLGRQRLLSSVSSGFALLALALVGTGLYGILSRAVSERRREIGIRMALGAQRGEIVIALAWEASLRIVFGIASGAVLALLVGRIMHSLLYGVSANSPSIAAATLAVLIAVLALAFVLPARRAASMNPMEVIRDE